MRKHIGHGPTAAEHAAELQRFYMAYFNPYLNFHRPCGFAQLELTDNCGAKNAKNGSLSPGRGDGTI